MSIPRANQPLCIPCIWGLLAILGLTPHATAAPELADDPLRLDRAGILLRVPVGATAQTRTLANRQVTTVSLPDNLGTIILQSRQVDTPATSTAADDTARLMREVLGIPTDERFSPDAGRRTAPNGTYLGPGPEVTTRGGPARPLYAEVRTRGTTTPVLRGIAVVDVEAERRVVFDLLAGSDRSAEARETFEAVLATTTPRQTDAAARTDEAERRTAAALLAQIDRSGFTAIVEATEPVFERLYRPSAAGGANAASERGYRRTVVRTGHRGDVTGTPRSNRSNAENEPGFVVAVDARLLGETGERIDSKALYFLSENRREETWSVTMSVRSEGPPTVWTETGARDGRDLTISVAQGRSGRRTVRPSIRVEGFLSRVESLLLPRLLATLATPGTYTFAAYDSQTESVVERTETLTRTDRGWQLRTVYDDGRGQTSTLSPGGSPVRTELDSGLVWETTDFDTLYDLWSRKGLPLD